MKIILFALCQVLLWIKIETQIPTEINLNWFVCTVKYGWFFRLKLNFRFVYKLHDYLKYGIYSTIQKCRLFVLIDIGYVQLI